MSTAAACCWGVVPAAGIGSRMGSDIPKQYLELAGVALLEHSVRALLSCEQVLGVVVALHAEDTLARDLPFYSDPRVSTVTGKVWRKFKFETRI